MAGDGIRPYFGEFLVSTAPLELSGNWCSHACSYCIDENADVLLANLRTRKGKDVLPGDVLLGFSQDSRYRKWDYAVVEEVFSREAEGIRVYLENGETVDCTPDHHFFTGRNGDIEYAPVTTKTGKLAYGKRLHRINLPLLPEEPFSHDFMKGYISGVLEGDGAAMNGGAYKLALADMEPLYRCQEFCEKLGYPSIRIWEWKDYSANPEKHRPLKQTYFPVGHPACLAQNLPDCDFKDKENLEFVKGWMSGIYDAEGNTPARRTNKGQSALRISQYQNVNPSTYSKICAGFEALGFDFKKEDQSVRLSGTRDVAARFIQLIRPAILRKANPLIGTSLKGMQEKIPVVKVEAIGKIKVASFRTSTHNYVSCGVLSRNCFANGAKPDRQLDLKGVMALLRNSHERTGLDAILLNEKYPVVISNHVDPFSKSNARQMVDIMRLMTDLDIPITFQTRGGEEWAIAATLDFIKPSVFYISITHQTEETRELIEPHAPTMQHRYELIDEVIRRGHRVLVGLNPLVPEWIPEPELIIDKLWDMGVEGLWIETFHLNRYQKAGMKGWQKKRLGDDMIKKAMKLRTCDTHQSHFLRAREYAISIGMPVYTAGQHGRSDFFEPYHETYEKTFPVWQDFVNFCIDNSEGWNRIVDWELYRDFFYSRLPKVGKTPQHQDYLRQGIHRELSTIPYLRTREKRFNYGMVLQYAYADNLLKKVPMSPLSQATLSPVVDNGRVVYKDTEGNLGFKKLKGYPLFYFDETGETAIAEL